ncbi:hypothetical protein BTUL_0217g00020 [Botrytis tulipae]|uniref:Uncharacterized protein n=1 Tax=Botrytis tulipae TaxID=87230 RepID=A0A4Z1ECL3_9HELO|nr:hypothetical protein BTUL_0217g00020 [Botrytis tulipae]
MTCGKCIGTEENSEIVEDDVQSIPNSTRNCIRVLGSAEMGKLEAIHTQENFGDNLGKYDGAVKKLKVLFCYDISHGDILESSDENQGVDKNGATETVQDELAMELEDFYKNITLISILKSGLEERKLRRRPDFTQELKINRNGSSHITKA